MTAASQRRPSPVSEEQNAELNPPLPDRLPDEIALCFAQALHVYKQLGEVMDEHDRLSAIVSRHYNPGGEEGDVWLNNAGRLSGLWAIGPVISAMGAVVEDFTGCDAEASTLPELLAGWHDTVSTPLEVAER